VYSGPGGQTVFATAACSSEGGRSVIAVPASSLAGDGQRYSRIVPELPLGTAVTVPRTYVDYVVTEFGIATLRGKSVRERAEEMCNIAHPDFRGDLITHAKSKHWM
jgi:4-hydroxybutyrate CoA-transferase